MFEGTVEAATAFAALDTEALVQALKTPSLLPTGGRLTRIVTPDAAGKEPEEITRGSQQPPAGPEAGPHAAAAVERPMPALEGLQGVYFVPRQVFTGDVVSSTPGRAMTHLSLVEGAVHMPTDTAAFDADCVIVALRYLVEGAKNMLFLPVCYSNIVRPAQRQAYERALSMLPAAHQKQFTATVYDTPRDPAFGALTDIRTMLSKYVANIDLQTNDPGFEIEKLPLHAVSSVTLVLPEAEPRVRLAALRRFADRFDLYKRKQIWPGVTNVRSHAELLACVAVKAPFVTGAGVCRLQTLPMGGRALPLDDLPILAA